MQSTRVSIGICHELEKTQRTYIKNHVNSRKINYINWKTMCLLKDRGGCWD